MLDSWVQINKKFERKIVISFDICFGAQKNPHIESFLFSSHSICLS